MSADALLSLWVKPARQRAAAKAALTWMPAVLVASAAAWRVGGTGWAVAALLLGAALVAIWCLRLAGRYDRVWLIRSLDARRSDLEDSSDLLFCDPASLGPLQRLQRGRLEARLADGAPEALVEEWSGRRIALAWAAALVLVAAILLWPASASPGATSQAATERKLGVAAKPRLVGQRIRIIPPAYTGLPARETSSLDIRAPQGSRIEWALRYDPDPTSAALSFVEGERLALVRGGEDWTARRQLDKSMLYRVEAAGADPRTPSSLRRMEAIPDAPPQVRAVSPEQGLVLVTPGQRSWTVTFEASDDYGVAPTGRMSVTIAQGEGENVTFHERSFAVRGTGSGKTRRFTTVLNLASLGLQRGGDLVAQITVADTRSPSPQVVRSSGVILRWPPEAAEPSGLELMSKRVLPAYFRSQRQIIIDAEALISQRRRLSGDAFVERSDAIGVDQRLLRLRYGQFLGEEASGGPQRPLLPTADAQEEAAAPAADDHEEHEGEEEKGAGFGAESDVLADYGHTHDESEAATLLDPDTRALLKQALDEMWQSERHLRTGEPDRALPYAYKALAFIKQVQQSTRIFLAKVGPQLPPVDEARRLTGKREGIASRPSDLAPVDAGESIPAAAWRLLADAPGEDASRIDLDSLNTWVRDNEGLIPDPLGLRAAIDDLRRDPDCARCRRALKSRLWSVLPRPAAQVRRRDDGGTMGRRYLQGLR